MRTLLCFVLLSGCGMSHAAIDPPDDTTPRSCAEGEWCWVRGRPVTLVGGAALDQVFAIGADGWFARWRDGGWEPQAVPTSRTLTSAWIAGPGDLFATDDAGSVWHHDGSAWTETVLDGAFIVELRGTDDGVLWAYGGYAARHGPVYRRQLFRYDAGAWTHVVDAPPGCIESGSLVALSGGEVLAASLTCAADGTIDSAVVVRRDGDAWAPMGSPIPDQRSYPGFEWVGSTLRLDARGPHEWDGTQWQPVEPVPVPTTSVGESAYWDGTRYTIIPQSVRCAYAWRVGDDVWCYADDVEQISHRSGDAWRETLADPFAGTMDAEAWGTVPPTLWAGSDTHRAWGSGPGDVYRLRWSTEARLEHFDGSRWTFVDALTATDVSGSGPDDVWLASEDGLRHYDGSAFAIIALPSELDVSHVSRVLAVSRGVALLAVDEARLLRYDGAWSVVYAPLLEYPTQWDIDELVANGLDDVWLIRSAIIGRVGNSALVHFDGASWTDVDAWIESPAALAMRDGQAWVVRGGSLTNLSTPLATPIEDVLWAPYDAALWLGADSFWLTTSGQAKRRSR